MDTLAASASITKLAILGLGLIGGSLALAAKQRGIVQHVSAWGRRTQNLQTGLDRGVIDSFSLDLADVIVDADVIVVATPVLMAEQLLVDLFAKHNTQAIVTDVGSTKGNLLRAVQQGLGYVPPNLVLGHPIAGSESSGIDAVKVDLYERHRVILTPTSDTDAAHLACIQSLWSGVGAEVICMDVEQHDHVLAATSHLPHMLAYSLVDTLSSMEEEQEVFRFAAGGFRDFTRIAKSHPTMWHDIAMANKSALLKSLDDFVKHLLTVRECIDQGDSERLIALFSHVA
ncbi:MAG: prephenate dehydrogenase/arogenate dehydrogenase family protein [Pseudomonadota bacterium]